MAHYLFGFGDNRRTGPGDIVNAALMSERPIWVISCLMMFYGQALYRMDEINSLNWQEMP